jgi:hypothetical protein
MLFFNPAPKGFKSSASKDVSSENTLTKALSTEEVITSAKEVHKIFQDKGYYKAIKDSDMYIKGDDEDA